MTGALLWCLLWASAGRAEVRASLEVGGRTRTYAAHLPAGWDGMRPLPLVLAFHGAGRERPGSKAGQLADIAHLNALSDSLGALVLYPDGVLRRWADGRNDSQAEREGVDDLAFADALIAAAAARWPVDDRRVYATGFSNGAFLTQRLACTRSARFAAVAAVSGTLAEGLDCAPAQPVPVMVFLNTADPVVPWAGGEIAGHRGRALGGMEDAALWARNNRCTDGPVEELQPDARRDGTRVSRLAWTGCAADVVLYRVDGGGHTWPGGRQYLPRWLIGRASRDIDATAVIAAFFQAHTLTPEEARP